jgi:hypothetical protein
VRGGRVSGTRLLLNDAVILNRDVFWRLILLLGLDNSYGVAEAFGGCLAGATQLLLLDGGLLGLDRLLGLAGGAEDFLPDWGDELRLMQDLVLIGLNVDDFAAVGLGAFRLLEHLVSVIDAMVVCHHLHVVMRLAGHDWLHVLLLRVVANLFLGRADDVVSDGLFHEVDL